MCFVCHDVSGVSCVMCFVCHDVSGVSCVMTYPHDSPGRRKVIRCLIFICHFPQKSPIISGSFAKHEVQLGTRQAEGLQPLAAARHRGRTRASVDCTSEPSFSIFLISDIFSHFFLTSDCMIFFTFF